MLWAVTVVLALAVAQTVPPTVPPTEVGVGRAVAGRITTASPRAALAGLRPGSFGEAEVRAAAYSFRPVADGLVTVDVRALAFDAHLVVRRDDQVVAEDDNGWMASDPRLWLRAEAGHTYTLEVLARDGGHGEFELNVRAGRAPGPDAAARLARAREGLAFAEAAHGPEHAAVAQACATLAAVLRSQGHADAARPLYERALAVRVALHGDEHGEVATAHSNLGNCFDDLGRFADAQAAHETALRIEHAAAVPQPRALAAFHNNLGTVLQHQGRIAEAVRHLRRALQLKEQVFGPDAPELVVNWSNLGTAELDLGQLDDARASCARAVALAKPHLPGTQQQYLLAVANLALVDSLAGREVEAVAALRALLPELESWNGKDSPMTALVRANLGNLLGILGDTATAIALHEQALAALTARLGAEHALVRTAEHPLAMVKLIAGELVEGERRLRGLLEWFGNREAVFHLRRSQLLAQHALACLMLRQPDRALAAVQQLRSLATADAAGGDVLDDFTYIEALARAASGDAAGARRALRGTLAARRQRVATQLLAMPESERAHWLLRERDCLDLWFALAVGEPEAALAYCEVLAWKGLLARGLTQQLQWLRAQVEPRLVAAVDRHRAITAALARADAAQRVALADERQALERQLLTGAVAMVGPEPEVATLCAALDEREALVDFFVYDAGRPWLADPRPTVAAFVVRRGGVQRVELGSAAELDRAVAAFVQVTSRRVAGSQPSAAAVALGERLRSLVWLPLAAGLSGAERIWLSPDGGIATLPFETLPGAREGSFLLEELDLRYIGNAAALCTAVPDAAPAEGVLLVGGVDYGGVSAATDVRSGYGPLPGSAAEILALRELWPGARDVVRVLDGAAASEVAVRTAVAGRAFVHLATHGRYFAPREAPDSRRALSLMFRAALDPSARIDLAWRWPGMRSGLALAGANLAPAPEGRGDDGFLSADELAWLDLRGCRLATLSACESGLGATLFGESLIGLRRALRVAGARASLTSLWPVGDTATRALMQSFYRRLWRDGVAPDVALRAAKLEMLQTLRARHGGEGLPGAWGGFVLESASR